jgi:lactate dehydrogenase-like 2-hydroxyacid dehydrogenase
MTTRIVVLERIEMTDDQRKKLQALGNVDWFDSSTPEECQERVKNADVVVIDWINPDPFLLSLKRPSLLALMSTGYGWVDIKKARGLNISVSNVPGYATEAVAEHIIGLALAVARKTQVGDKNIRLGKKEKGYLRGLELRGRTMGIIGLGRIGKRVAEIANCLGMRVITYNRTPKKLATIKDVSLEDLLKDSDVVCVSCPLNEDSKDMLDIEKLKLMKEDAILVGTTWSVVKVDALIHVLESKLIHGAGFDVAIEGEKIILPKKLIELDNVVLTPHIGFNTVEAKRRQVDICISNIEQYLKGNPTNIVN